MLPPYTSTVSHDPMTVTLDAISERLLLKQLQTGAFADASEAVEAPVQQAFGGTATPELEALLDEALNHPGRRIPLEELRASRP